MIIGASSNMGHVAAFWFAREGANLEICISTKTAELRQVRDEALAFSAKVVGGRYDDANGNFVEISGVPGRP